VAFYQAGFETWYVCMQDLLDTTVTLDMFDGLAFVGGFSYAVVFGCLVLIPVLVVKPVSERLIFRLFLSPKKLKKFKLV